MTISGNPGESPLDPTVARRRTFVWAVPAVILVVLLGLTALVWRMESIDEWATAQNETSNYAQYAARRVDQNISSVLRPVRRRWWAGKFAKQTDFSAQFTPLIANAPTIEFAAWVDRDGVCRQATRAGQYLLGQKLSDQSLWGDLFNNAKSNAMGAATSVTTAPNGNPILFCALGGTDGRSDSDHVGQIFFRVNLLPLFNPLSDPRANGRFTIEIADAGKPFFQYPPQHGFNVASVANSMSAGEPLNFLDRTWVLRASPTEAFIQQHQAQTPLWAICLWLAGSFLLVLSVFYEVIRRQREDRRQIAHLHSLEKVAEISAAIFGKMGAKTEIWQQLVDAAASLMDMSMSAVVVLEENNQFLRFVATAGVDKSMIGLRLRVADMKSAQESIRTRKPVACSDVKVSDPGVNAPMAQQYGVRSFIHVPLFVREEMIGLMMLANNHPRPFTAADLRLAQLWGGLASVAIANERAYDQTSEALDARNRLLQQRDALYAVHDSILGQESAQDILQRIADLAPAPVDVDCCQIVLQSETPGELFVAATTTHYGAHLKGYRFPAAGTNSGRVVEQGLPLIVEDGPNDSTMHPFLRTQLPCDSVIFQPLLGTGGRAMGLLVFLREKAGSFSKEQMELAQIFAGRAAAAIEIAQLYEQTRRDASTKATLLRELKHRVKNNLAGIVALLSMREPQLPPKARQWLDRVVERVRTLSETHDLLIGGQDRVAVEDLIQQSLRSLAVVRRPGINVHVNAQKANVLLRNQRAVSVAMVLHELCYNALVHGFTETGTLQLLAAVEPSESSAAGPPTLVIQVIDDGCGFSVSQTAAKSSAVSNPPIHRQAELFGNAGSVAAVAEPPGRLAATTGLGLELVQDFVQRELRGRFTVDSQPGAGTTARVEFTLLEDEWVAMV